MFCRGQSAGELEEKLDFFYTENLDSSLFYANKLEQLYLSQSDYESAFWANYDKVNLCSRYFKKARNKQYLEELNLFLKNYKEQLEDLSDYVLMQKSYEYMLASYHYELNNYTLAWSIFQTISDDLIALQKTKDDEYLNNVFVNSLGTMGTIRTKEHRNEEANRYFNFAIDYVQQANNIFNFLLPNLKYTYGKALALQGDYRKANEYLTEAFYYTKATNGNKNRLGSISGIICQNYTKLNQRDSVLHYLKMQEEFLPPEHPFWEDHFISKAQFHIGNQEYSKAKESLRSAIPFSIRKWNFENHPYVAKLHGILSEVYLKENKTDSAVIQINKAISKVQSYQIETIANQVILLELYQLKSKILSQGNEAEQADSVVHYTKLAIEILDQVNQKMSSNDDLINLMESSYTLFETGIEAAFDREQPEDVLYFMEKSKANTLLRSFYNSKAFSVANVPDEIIERERQLKSEIAHYEEDAQKSDVLIDLNRKLEDLVKKIENDYPDYYNLKYGNKTLSLKKLQKKLKKNQQLIIYFYGSKQLYGLAVSSKKVQLVKIRDEENMFQQISSYYEALKDPNYDLEETQKMSSELYLKILKPLLFTSQPRYSELLIIPDGPLSYLPFDTFYDQGNYLLEKYSVGYAPSANLLFALDNQSSKNKLLAFAPNFSNSSLSPLPNNRVEVESIGKYFTTTQVTDQNATKQYFIDESSKFNLFHFATHAITIDDFPENSFLAFSNTTNDQENNLFVREIYNLPMNMTKMITLSACETGIGELKKGEGFLSLARAFFYSGAKSITSTLWKINDRSASEIMTDYYSYLKKGKSKDKALQLAKLDYLQKNKGTNLTHPYYWSAFTVSGNTDAINTQFSWWWLLLAFAGLSLMIVYVRKYRFG